MKIEIRTSSNSIKLLSVDEVFIKICREMIRSLDDTENVVVEDRESAIRFLKSYEQRLVVHQEETTTFTFEIKLDVSKLKDICNRIVKSKMMSQLRKIIITIIKQVFIKLLVEIILSLIHDSNRDRDYAILCLS